MAGQRTNETWAGIGYPSGRACSPGWGSCSVRCGQSQGSQLAIVMPITTTRSRTGLVLPLLIAGYCVLALAVGLVLGLTALLAVLGLPAVAGLAYLVWQLEPAYTLSFALLLSPIAGNWHDLHFPTGADPDRLLLAVGILQVLFRSPGIRDRPRIRVTVPHVLLGLAVLWAVVSAYRAQTLFVKDTGLKLVDAFGLLPFLGLFVAPLAFRTARQRGILLTTLVVMAAWLGLTTLFEVAHVNALVFPRYILNKQLGIHYARGRGPFLEAVTNGFALFFCSTICAVAVANWKGRRARIAAAAIGTLCFAVAFASQERSVWIGIGVGTIVALLATRESRRWFVPVAMVVAVLAASAFAFIPGVSRTYNNRVNDVGTLYDRQNLTTAGLNMIQAKPLTGFGWSRFQASSQLYFRRSQDFPLTATTFGIHNVPLTYAVELGLPGLALWGFGLLLAIGGALMIKGPPDLRAWRVALFAVASAFIVISNSVPPSLFPMLSLMMLTGVVASGAYDTSRWRRGAAPAAPEPVAAPLPG